MCVFMQIYIYIYVHVASCSHIFPVSETHSLRTSTDFARKNIITAKESQLSHQVPSPKMKLEIPSPFSTANLPTLARGTVAAPVVGTAICSFLANPFGLLTFRYGPGLKCTMATSVGRSGRVACLNINSLWEFHCLLWKVIILMCTWPSKRRIFHCKLFNL